ncbi:hypothetical protein CVD27_21710 [Neobacillus cucumis]|uniref:DUF304 domain-containing protein n=1 Tax=Neobacillus cucumis TaxID=1740721 RepID=A0A2N5H986_9BACI|nr:hypothetical protein CVD27_21710 [Neobacillus cucumis]
MAGLFLHASSFRKVISVIAGIVGIGFFGRMFILMAVLLVKKPVLVGYDDNQLIVKGQSIPRKNITKLEQVASAPVGMLGIKTPAFVLNCGREEKITIPTYHVLSGEEEAKIRKTLNKYINER